MIKFSKSLSNLREFEIQYKLDKKYPNIFTADDPEIILEAIDHWKKYRRF